MTHFIAWYAKVTSDILTTNPAPITMFTVQNTYFHHYCLLHGPVMEKYVRYDKKQLNKVGSA